MPNRSLPETVGIPGGSFWMGSDRHYPNEAPRHDVWIDPFILGKYPVTNREYRTFVDESGAAAPPFWNEPMFSDPQKPVVGVTWYEATAYCEWLRGRTGEPVRLPTEAEWERAARGMLADTLYPWGDEPPSARPYAGCDLLRGGPDVVGANDPNTFGLYDMSEGVHEWCCDWYDRYYYRRAPDRNPQGPAAGARRVSRGGSWRHHVKFSRCSARSSLPPDFRYADYGFRIALTTNGGLS